MRVVLGLLLALVTLGALLGCATPSAEPTTVELTVTADAPAETRTVTVPLGSPVTLKVTSEVDGVLHVHGYEREVSLATGATVEETFTASMAGAFEIETHDPAAVWLKLVVR